MMRSEFEELIGTGVNANEYDEIELVYTYHPSISDTEGKKQMAELYTNYGMTVIRGMVPVAKAMRSLDAARIELQRREDNLNKRAKYLSEGRMDMEDAITKIEEAFEEAEGYGEFDDWFAKMKVESMDAELWETARAIVGC